jgi:hypothetical protein
MLHIFSGFTCFVYIARRMLRRMADGVRLAGLDRQGGLLPDASTTYNYATVSHIRRQRKLYYSAAFGLSSLSCICHKHSGSGLKSIV